MISQLDRHDPDAPGERRADVLRLEAIQKSYGAERVLDDVSLHVAEGEFMTLLGPSGSGKTTTLMCVAGFVDVDAGTISLEGRDVSLVPAHKRNIGMVFQSYALFPHLNVYKNVAFPLGMRGIKGSAARTRVERILEVVGLSGYGERTPRQLSGGQQQRVALARAMVFDPRLLLMDEPLGALDKNLRTQLQTEIVRISRELGATTLYVTHDQEEAMTMSDRIAVYKDGRIRQCGTPEEVYARPNCVFVGEFLGESNVLRGERSSADTFKTTAGLVLPTSERPDGLDGARTAMLVRPEAVDVEPLESGGSSADWTRIEGTVLQLARLGADQRRVVDTPVGKIVSRTSHRADAPALAVGDAVTVSWPTAAAQILRDE